MNVEKIMDEEGNFPEIIRYNGHVFFASFNRDIAKRLTQLFPRFQIEKDDIILCSFPRTGTHWFNNIIGMLKHGNTEYKGSPFFIEYHNLDAMPKPRVYASHLRYELLPEAIKTSKDIKIINLLRNPKDTLVSYFIFMKSLWKNEKETFGSFNSFFNFYLSKDFYFDGWFEYVKSWDDALNTNVNNTILRISYEETKEDVKTVIKKLNDFLGTQRDDDFLKQVEGNVTLKTLKNQHKGEFQNVGGDLREFMKDGVLPVFRKGEVGDWKNYFTVAQNEKFDKEYKEIMKGYEHIPIAYAAL